MHEEDEDDKGLDMDQTFENDIDQNEQNFDEEVRFVQNIVKNTPLLL